MSLFICTIARCSFTLAVLLLGVTGAMAQVLATCGKFVEPLNSGDKPAPLIFGEPYSVPRMRIRFINGATGKLFQTESISVNYGWQWLEYPYPEHAWGAWSDGADSLSCKQDHEGWIDAPAHEVRPRGWYAGWYTRWPWSHRPYFDHVEVLALTGYFARTLLRPQDLRRFDQYDLVISVFDGWRAEIRWQARKP